MTPQRLSRIAWFICILVGIVLSLKALREPDLWWMFRTGEWMFENGAVTKADPFSYTANGTEWINVKWLFELILNLFKAIGGPEFIFVLQAIVSTTILLVLGKTANLLKTDLLKTEESPTIISFGGLLLAGLAALLLMDFRMIGRPEMMSHLMTTTYIFLLLKHRKNPSSKLIYLLIPLQILWTNLHEAFGLGMIIITVYLIANWVEYAMSKKWWAAAAKPAPKLLSIVVLMALAGVILNPRGWTMWLHPFNIYGQLQSNKFTTELVSVGHPRYWNFEAYGNFIFLAIAFLFVIATPFFFRKKPIPTTKEESQLEPKETKTKAIKSKSKSKKKRDKKPAPKPQTSKNTKAKSQKSPLNWLPVLIQKYGLGYLALGAMLFYLSLTAYRNIPFFIIASTPLVAIAIEKLLQRIYRKRAIQKWFYLGATLLAISIYGLVVSNKFYGWKTPSDTYGMQVLSGHNPVGAAQFIQDNNISGRCFSDYLTSAYLLWKLQPDFETYIDLRDLDIFEEEFFQEFFQITFQPPLFESKDSLYNFDYVVLFRPQFEGLHQHLIESPNYELVFVDAVAAVYLKKLAKHEALIQKYGFRQNGRKDIYTPLQPCSSSGLAYGLSKIFNPFFQIEDYTKTDHDLIAAAYYQSTNQIELGLALAKKSAANGIEDWKGAELLGNMYNNLAFAPTTPDSMRAVYTQKAGQSYDAALKEQPNYVGALLGKAVLNMQQSKFPEAIKLLNRSLAQDPTNLVVHRYLGTSYKVMANSGQNSQANFDKWIYHMEQLDKLQPNNPVTILDLGIAYCAIHKCKKAMEYLDKVEKTPNLPIEEAKTAARCRQTCGGR